MMRLQKYIAAAGIASRRKAEEIILAGRVMVNGKVVTELGTKVSGDDEVKVNNEIISLEEKQYLALHKPVGYVCTCDESHDERTIMELLPRNSRLFPVGRLDKDSCGLLLCTNDGDWAHKIMHPRFECDKEYIVRTKKPLRSEEKALLVQGVMLDEKPATLVFSEVKTNKPTEYRVIIHEGRKRQLRRMFEEIGHTVVYLCRVRIGSINLGWIKEGSYKALTEKQKLSFQ